MTQKTAPKAGKNEAPVITQQNPAAPAARRNHGGGIRSRLQGWRLSLLAVLAGCMLATTAPAALLRVELGFVDGSKQISVEQDAELRARAELTLQQPTLIRGQWEFSGPLSAGNFEVLKLVQLMAGGSGTMTLLSPLLPTSMNGSYRIRLCLQPPCDQVTELRYAVFPPR